MRQQGNVNLKNENLTTEDKLVNALNSNKAKKSKMVMISIDNTLITICYDSYKVVDGELIFLINGRESCIFPILNDAEITETVMGTLMVKFI